MSIDIGVAEVLAEPEVRIEAPLKVTGRARYVADVQMPGLLWADFLLSPLPHARIVSIDTTAARQVPGVHAVLTGAEIGLRFFGRSTFDWPVLAVDKVRYVGERVAAVAAETREAAEEALLLIQVEYEELPAVYDPEEALAPGAPILHEDPNSYASVGPREPVSHPNLQAYGLRTKGNPDIEQAFALADVVVEDTYTGARQHQGFIEPRGCVVWIEDDGTVQVVTTNKAPFGLVREMSRVTGVPTDKIVVDAHFIGGDFGGKGTSIEEFTCYYLAKATGRPVKAIFSYTKELTSGAPQHSAKYVLRTGATRDGKIVAHEVRAYLNNGAYAGGRPNAQTTATGGMQCLHGYAVPNARMEAFMTYTNQMPGGNMRAPGEAHRGLAGEAHIDHLARALGMDPLEFRILNAVRAEDTGLAGERFRNPRAVAVLETLRDETGWGKTPLAPNHGRGVAMRARHVGAGKGNLTLRLLPDARIEVISGAPDQGGGNATVVKRVVAAALSVDPERIQVRYGTTAEAPGDDGVGGSRATTMLGQASIHGSQNLKEKIIELASDAMDWPSTNVRIERDRFVVSGPVPDSAPFDQVAELITRGGPVEASGHYDPAGHRSAEGGDYNFYAYMVEVEVDPETGRVRPVDVVVVVDTSTIINPIAYQGQLDGGFIFGLGGATSEELLFEDGRVVNANLGDYKFLSIKDIPPLRTVLLRTDIGPGPFNAKAAGETTNTAVAGAVANAISDAVGVRIMTMPITAERVFEALQPSGS